VFDIYRLITVKRPEYTQMHSSNSWKMWERGMLQVHSRWQLFRCCLLVCVTNPRHLHVKLNCQF